MRNLGVDVLTKQVTLDLVKGRGADGMTEYGRLRLRADAGPLATIGSVNEEADEMLRGASALKALLNPVTLVVGLPLYMRAERGVSVRCDMWTGFGPDGLHDELRRLVRDVYDRKGYRIHESW